MFACILFACFKKDRARITQRYCSGYTPITPLLFQRLLESESTLTESMEKLSTADSNASGGSEMSTTLAKVDEMIAAGCAAAGTRSPAGRALRT